jgi:rfaE bifunctional protein kinase chain/domain
MKTVQFAQPRLAELLDRFPASRVAVLGDFFLDKYLEVDPSLEEISVETGKPAHQVVAVRCSPGAAGTVVCNLAALGAHHLHAIGFRGDDGEGFDLRKQLASLGCRTDHLHVVSDRYTPTYLKPRDAGDPRLDAEHSRYDTKNRQSISDALQQDLLRSLDALLPELDAVIVLDQVEQRDCGVVTGAVRTALADRAQRWPRTIFWADSRRRIGEFTRLIIKPNQFEAIGDEDPRPGDEVEIETLRTALLRLRQQNQAPVVVTRGERGMIVSDPEPTLVPGIQLTGPIDPTGAGDSATAAAVLALCAGAELAEAGLVGNLVASITVQQIGTTGVARPEQLPPRLDVWFQQQSQHR